MSYKNILAIKFTIWYKNCIRINSKHK